jgi:hypothetical protein
MDYEDGPLCPNCMTGILQQAADDAGHLVCSLCGVQSQVWPSNQSSACGARTRLQAAEMGAHRGRMRFCLQDVVVEQMEEYVDPGTLRHRVKEARAAPVAEMKTVDVEGQIMAYLKCVQHMIKLQMEVINSWFGCQGYEGVVKQVWKAIVLHSGLLDANVPSRCARPRSATQISLENSVVDRLQAESRSMRRIGSFSASVSPHLRIENADAAAIGQAMIHSMSQSQFYPSVQDAGT